MAPSAIIVTDRRVIIIHHSFWGLYFKFNLMNATEINIVEHKNIMSVALGRGKLFGTIRIRILGFVEATKATKYEWDLNGLWIKEALEVVNDIGRVVEKRSQQQDARISMGKMEEEADPEGANITQASLQKDSYEPPIAYEVKNDKIIAKENIATPKQSTKIYGKLLGLLLVIISIVFAISVSGVLIDSIFIFIIGVLLIKLA